MVSQLQAAPHAGWLGMPVQELMTTLRTVLAPWPGWLRSRSWAGSSPLCTGQASALIGLPATGHDALPELRGYFPIKVCDDVDISLKIMQKWQVPQHPFLCVRFNFFRKFSEWCNYFHYPILKHCHHHRKMAYVLPQWISIHTPKPG